MTEPHESRQFRNLAEYTVTITFRVEGGARWRTAHRRAARIAERLANHAARAAGVVEVTATGGASESGTAFSPRRVRFAAANSGRGTYDEPDKLDRYLDPEFERGLASLADAKAASRAAGEADEARRRTVGCLNTSRSGLVSAARCLCAYCVPGEHEHALYGAEAGQPEPLRTQRCICGRAVAAAGGRCARHTDVALVVLDGDPGPLQCLARRHPTTGHDELGPGLDGLELPPHDL